MKHPTTVERKSEREFIVTRTFDGPARLVYAAWTKPELAEALPVGDGARRKGAEPPLSVDALIGHG